MMRKVVVPGPVKGTLKEKLIDRGPAKYQGVIGPGLKTKNGGRVPPRGTGANS